MRQLACHQGAFGKVRIVERIDDGARYYFTAGSAQTLIDAEGTSLFGYVNAMKLLLRGHHKVLMIGGAGGSLASMLARKGHDVTVVDVDPLARHLAREYFALHPNVHWHTTDGLTYVTDKAAAFDAIVVDACNSKGILPAFTDITWILRAMNAVTPQGIVMLNLVHEICEPLPGKSLASDISDCGLNAALLSPGDGWEGNEILLVARKPMKIQVSNKEVLRRPAEVLTYLKSLKCYRWNGNSRCENAFAHMEY